MDARATAIRHAMQCNVRSATPARAFVERRARALRIE
jgi:hypothetical protein